MSKNSRNIIVIILIITIVNIYFIAIKKKRNKKINYVDIATVCDLKLGCSLPNGDIISTDDDIKLNYPFKLTLNRSKAKDNKIIARFTMKNMDMGEVDYIFKQDQNDKKKYIADRLYLPLCHDKRADYLLQLNIDKENIYIIPLKLDINYISSNNESPKHNHHH